MGYHLLLGDRAYSSWSLRGWLLLEQFGPECQTTITTLYSPALREDLQPFAPARTVPALKIDDTVVFDSLAIAETLAERHPEAGIWPENPHHRAVARVLCGEYSAADVFFAPVAARIAGYGLTGDATVMARFYQNRR